MAETEKAARVQTNLRLAADVARELDVASAIEHRDKAEIVEEGLRLRRQLMGEEYRALVEAALEVRFPTDAESRLRAIDAIREGVAGATQDGSVTVSAALARIAKNAKVAV
ncbi:MAG: hypothetical protein E6I56_10595 [Chloroflexi bacterium]|nr:MAG: hypothetical protein E6I56_10595 [Chloroflexota bacterium]